MGSKLIDNVNAIGSMIDFVGGIHYGIMTQMVEDDDNLILITSEDRDVYGECMICNNERGVFILFRTGSSRSFVFMVETVVYRIMPEILRDGDYAVVDSELEVSKSMCYSIKQLVEGGENGEKI